MDGMTLVIGATGTVGGPVVSGLVGRDVAVRALSRNPEATGLPAGVEVVTGDVSDPASVVEHLRGVDAVFLVWPYFGVQGAGELAEALAANVGRIVYLSAEAVRRRPDSAWATIEDAIGPHRSTGRSCVRPGSPPTR